MLPHQKNQQNWSDQWVAFLDGDIEAFEALHGAFYPDLFRYALKIQQNSELAEDAVQELFIKLWVKRASLPVVAHVKAYLMKALRRIMLNELRNLNLRSLHIKLDHQPDIVYSAEDILLKAEEQRLRKDKIASILNNLSKRQREVIYLRYFEEFDYQEIATILGINYQSALNLAQRALKTIRENFSSKSE